MSMEPDKEIPSSAEVVERRMKEKEAGAPEQSPSPIDPLHPKSNEFPRALDNQPDEGRSSTGAIEAVPGAPDAEAPPAPMVTASTQRINIRFVPVPDQGVILMQLSAPLDVLAMDRNQALTIARDLAQAAKSLPIIIRPGAGVIPGNNGHGTGLKDV